MPERYLLDADFLVALSKIDDTNHTKALKLARKLKQLELFLSPFTIPEAATVISHRVSQEAAIRFLKEIRRRCLQELALDFESILEADRIFVEQEKKGTSWPDCLNAALCHIHSLKGVVSFDRFYKELNLLME